MRVYEFAKQQKLSSAEVLSELKKLGFDLSSHMSQLPTDALEALNKKFAPKPKAPSKKAPPTKVEPKPAPKAKAAPKKVPAPAPRPAPKPAPRPKAPPSRPRARAAAQRASAQRAGAPFAQKKITEITVDSEMPLNKAASLMGRSEGDLILVLLKKGIVCSRNYILSCATITDLAHHFGIKVVAPTGSAEDDFIKGRLSVEEVMAGGKGDRWPIVVVMGHVDHGKTTLLDYVRKMNTAAKERGGITQHLSAYEVDSVHGKVVFLDTPGHEAFSYMRRRGTSVTDMVVLVVAADDGVKPQTVEVIKHAKAAGVPILVAVNKIDKVDPATAVERIKRQLAQHDLLAEDWGGDVICVPISAKTGQGVEELLEMITLQAQMMELKADADAPARGFVLESSQARGLGPVATVICLDGTIKVGDHFICGSSSGKVRLLINSAGERVQSAGPSLPVQVVGFDSFVSLGDWLTVVTREAYQRERTAQRKESQAVSTKMFEKTQEEGIPLLIKTDTHGSREAVIGAVQKINLAYPDIPAKFRVVYNEVGDISERDIETASVIGAIVLGLHVKAEKKTIAQARKDDVPLHVYGIIYEMTDYLEKKLKEYEEEVVTLKKVGRAVVRKVFDLGKRGTIAGCYVSDGTVSSDNIVVCTRKGAKIGEGKIVSLQKERKPIKQVNAGFECGFITDSFHGWEVEDSVECFVEEKKKRSEVS